MAKCQVLLLKWRKNRNTFFRCPECDKILGYLRPTFSPLPILPLLFGGWQVSFAQKERKEERERDRTYRSMDRTPTFILEWGDSLRSREQKWGFECFKKECLHRDRVTKKTFSIIVAPTAILCLLCQYLAFIPVCIGSCFFPKEFLPESNSHISYFLYSKFLPLIFFEIFQKMRKHIIREKKKIYMFLFGYL